MLFRDCCDSASDRSIPCKRSVPQHADPHVSLFALPCRSLGPSGGAKRGGYFLRNGRSLWPFQVQAPNPYDALIVRLLIRFIKISWLPCRDWAPYNPFPIRLRLLREAAVNKKEKQKEAVVKQKTSNKNKEAQKQFLHGRAGGGGPSPAMEAKWMYGPRTYGWMGQG